MTNSAKENSIPLTFIDRPPPKEVSIQPLAESLNLLPGFRAEVQQSGGWRCGHCREYQLDEAMIVWIPDSVLSNWGTDNAEAIIEQCRRIAFNGTSSGICLNCAQFLTSRARIKSNANFKSVPREIPQTSEPEPVSVPLPVDTDSTLKWSMRERITKEKNWFSRQFAKARMALKRKH